MKNIHDAKSTMRERCPAVNNGACLLLYIYVIFSAAKKTLKTDNKLAVNGKYLQRLTLRLTLFLLVM